MITFLNKGAVLLTFALFTVCNTYSFSQTDSVSVNIQFGTMQDPDSSQLTLNVMDLDVTAPDIDFVGAVLITVYDTNSNFPIARIKRSKVELENQNLISGNTMNVALPNLDPSQSYRIETLVRNFQGANYPLNVSYYTGQ